MTNIKTSLVSQMRIMAVALCIVSIAACKNATASDSRQSLAGGTANIEFHDIESDTTRINDMLAAARSSNLTNGDAVVEFATRFLGTPYVAHTLEGDTEVLRVNLDEIDCTTLVETVMAMALTVNERRSTWRDFTRNLKNIRYRNGVIDGYPSRLHYISDWAIDNSHRGNFREVTSDFASCKYIVKSIDFMSANADKYRALADSTTLEAIKKVELGLSNTRYPYIKSTDLANKNVYSGFHNGDIVGLTIKVPNLDVGHMGVIVLRDGKPYLLHASSSAGKVVLCDEPLGEYLRKARNFTGVRVFRIAD